MINRVIFLSVIFFAVVLLTGCDLFNSADHTDAPRRELPRELSVHELMISEASNDFSFQLLHKLMEKEGDQSFFASPLCISTAFAMALNGAEGETYEQMRDFFGYAGMTNNEINQAYKDLIGLLINLDSQVVMNIANSIWIREGFPVLDDFLNSNSEYFNAEISELDFSSPQAPDIINSWIDEKTNGLIDKMIEGIDPLVVMYLINAIYFNGDWTVQFDPEKTRNAPFYLADGTQTEVPMMQARQMFRYYEDSEWTALDMWYGNNGFSFTALIPTDNKTLEEQLPGLTEGRFSSITRQLEQDTINVFVPKFELDYEIDGFPDMLKEMGLTLPFGEPETDFSRINKDEYLYISDVMHRAVIKLDEEGSEAAAVTVIGFSTTSAGGGKSYKTIRLDRPFVFFIRENSSNSLLFMGAFNGME